MSGKVVYSKNGKVVMFEEGASIRNMQGGVIITCKVCHKQEVVNEDSICDIWKLCINHARKKLEVTL